MTEEGSPNAPGPRWLNVPLVDRRGRELAPSETRPWISPAIGSRPTEGTRAAPVNLASSLNVWRDHVIGVNVTFEYSGDFDRARVVAVAENARGTFEGMPGLRFKFFTFDEMHHRATNFYVWDSKDAAEGFFSEELRERVTGLYGVRPTIDFVEIAQMVDNSAA